jgi:hydrogenase maturation protease
MTINNQAKVLLLGVGNDILKDDGIGPWVCDQLKKEINHPQVHFENINLGGLDVLEYIKDFQAVYIFDAIKTIDGQIGDVFLLSRSNFKETCHLSSLHDVGFLTALELGEHLDMAIPSEIRIAAIEIREDLVFGTEFTPELQKKTDEIMEIIREEVKNWLSELHF